jgi:hypothetical protein
MRADLVVNTDQQWWQFLAEATALREVGDHRAVTALLRQEILDGTGGGDPVRCAWYRPSTSRA